MSMDFLPNLTNLIRSKYETNTLRMFRTLRRPREADQKGRSLWGQNVRLDYKPNLRWFWTLRTDIFKFWQWFGTFLPCLLKFYDIEWFHHAGLNYKPQKLTRADSLKMTGRKRARCYPARQRFLALSSLTEKKEQGTSVSQGSKMFTLNGQRDLWVLSISRYLFSPVLTS